MATVRIPKFIRIAPLALTERDGGGGGECMVTGPADFVAALKPRYGVVVASWDEGVQLGTASRLGVVVRLTPMGAVVKWAAAALQYRPSPAGRRFWAQAKPFFVFAPDVAERYLLAPTFAEHFPELEVADVQATRRVSASPRLSGSPTGGYVYLVRSPYGVKIGKSVNVKSRTRLFEVKLPFPITVEHYAWFDDYSFAERDLHRQYHAKRLEGEWFDLCAADIAHIRKLGKAVPWDEL